MTMLELQTDELHVTVDPGRGADVLSLLHRPSGIDVLFSTPWRAHADAIREGSAAVSAVGTDESAVSAGESTAAWMEQYRGGWQTLLPNAGPPRLVAGTLVGFHGEASVVPWRVERSSATTAALSVNLESVAVTVDRMLTLTDGTLTTIDTLRSRCRTPLEIDYVSHPALGGAFLEGDCAIETGAGLFTADPGSPTGEARAEGWPWSTIASADPGARVDLRRVPPRGEPRVMFGWLSDFSEHRASVTNRDLGLAVHLEWDGTHLPYAWFWQELQGSVGEPWNGEARVIAIEPSSTQTGGIDRRSALRLAPGESVRIAQSITVRATDRPAPNEGEQT